MILDHIFGSGPGFSDRLGRIVRDELGLVYSIGGGMTDSADVVPGLFRVYAGTMPEEADRVVARDHRANPGDARRRILRREVDRARQYLAGAWVFDYQTVEQRAERLLELEPGASTLDEPLARGPTESPPSHRDRSARPPESIFGPKPFPRRAWAPTPSG